MAEILNRLLFLFYKYEVPYLLYIEKGKLKGFFSKEKVESAKSRIRGILIDKKELIEPIKGLEDILSLYKKAEKESLPVLNKDLKEQGFWRIHQAIQALEKITKVEKFFPSSLPKVQLHIPKRKDYPSEILKQLPFPLALLSKEGVFLYKNPAYTLLASEYPFLEEGSSLIKKIPYQEEIQELILSPNRSLLVLPFYQHSSLAGYILYYPYHK